MDQDALEDLLVLVVQLNQVCRPIFFHNTLLDSQVDQEDQHLPFLQGIHEILEIQVNLENQMLQKTLSFHLYLDIQVAQQVL